MMQPRHQNGGSAQDMKWVDRKMIFLGGNEDWDIWFRPATDAAMSNQTKSYLRLMHVKAFDWDDFGFTKDGKLDGATISPTRRAIDNPDKVWGEWGTHGLRDAEVQWVEQYVTLFAPWVWENGQ